MKCLRALEPGRVARGRLAAQVVPGVDVLELGAEDGGVDVVQAAVEAEAVDVAGVGTVVAQFADARVDIRIIGDDRAAVAERAEILLNDETGGGGVAQLPDLEAVAVRADALGVVLDDEQLVFGRRFCAMAFMSAHWP